MLRTYFAALATAALFTGPAYADTTSAAQQVTNAIAIAGGGGSSGDSSQHYSGSIANVPSIAGGYMAGTNNCLVGAGAGGAGVGFGFTFNVGVSSKPCDARNDAAALFTMGHDMNRPDLMMAAVYRMCAGGDVHDALKGAGIACPGDKPAAGARVAPAQAVVPAAYAPPLAPAKPGYCGAYGRGSVPPPECK